MSTIKYIFRVNGRSVNPHYKDDTSKDYELESGQLFFRASLNGTIAFVNDEYDWLENYVIDQEFELTINYNNGTSLIDYFTGVFYKTDGKWDKDNKIVAFKINTKDQYTDVLAKYEVEYDLVKMSIPRSRVRLQKRPLIQIYSLGDSVISCFLGGTYWEQDVTTINSETQIKNVYNFGLASTLYRSHFYTSLSEEIIPFKGEYVSKNKYVHYANNNEYLFTYETYGEAGGTRIDGRIIRSSDNQIVYTTPIPSPLFVYNESISMIPYVGGGYEGTGSGNIIIFSPIKIFMRYLLDVDTFQGEDTKDLALDDMVGDNRNYRKCSNYTINLINITANTSPNATKYGLTPANLYYTEPYESPTGSKYFPIARSTWIYSSVWFNYTLNDLEVEETGRKTYTLKDSYLISDVISSMLLQIDSSIIHEPTSDYSEFLYGINPLTSTDFRILITQKSNILAGEYDRSAQKAPLMFQTLMSMLANTMQLYWFIDSNKKFRIEHISWFKNGGSYEEGAGIGIDLSVLYSKNRKALQFGQGKYEYEKQNLPERLEFGWMDDVTASFLGLPIIINSKFVQRDKKDDINVYQFTSDIDYMLLNPNSFSMDGFALIAGVFSETYQSYELPFLTFNIDGINLVLQNGYMSMIYLHSNFWKHDLPSLNVNINTEDTIALGVKRTKKQVVKFPALDDPDPLELIKTSLGDGQIEKLSINLASRNCQATLKYDTE